MSSLFVFVLFPSGGLLYDQASRATCQTCQKKYEMLFFMPTCLVLSRLCTGTVWFVSCAALLRSRPATEAVPVVVSWAGWWLCCSVSDLL